MSETPNKFTHQLLRETRNLNHKKNKRVILGYGTPLASEGDDGDFRLHSTQKGVKLYTKYNGQWYGFTPDEAPQGENETLSMDENDNIKDAGMAVFGNGFRLQWGSFSASGDVAVTFAPSFPNKCIQVYFTGYDASGTGGSATAPELKVLPTVDGFTASASSTGDTVYWLAIGN